MPVDLAEVAEEAVRSVTPLAEERQVHVLLDPAPTPLVGDPLRLRQLVTILADNAIKHSPEGSTVTVHVAPAADAAHLTVDDEGPGVRPEDMPPRVRPVLARPRRTRRRHRPGTRDRGVDRRATRRHDRRDQPAAARSAVPGATAGEGGRPGLTGRHGAQAGFRSRAPRVVVCDRPGLGRDRFAAVSRQK